MMTGLSAVHPSSVHHSLICLQEITDPWPSLDQLELRIPATTESALRYLQQCFQGRSVWQIYPVLMKMQTVNTDLLIISCICLQAGSVEGWELVLAQKAQL